MSNDGIVVNFEPVLQAAINNLGALIATFFLLICWFKKDAIIATLRGYLDGKNVALDRRTDELAKINERYFHLYENSSRALEKVSEAIVSFKEGLFLVESRLNSKIDQEMEDIRTEIRNNKIDQLTLVIKDREKSSPNLNLEARSPASSRISQTEMGAKGGTMDTHSPTAM